MARGKTWLGAAVALGVVAYRGLLELGIGGGGETPAAVDSEQIFFAPDTLSPLLVLPLSAWLLWNRLPELVALPRARGAAWSLLLAVAALAIFWSRRMDAPDLALPSLGALMISLAWQARGPAGARRALLPALVLLAAMPIPSPVMNAALWWLQVLTTWSAVTLLDTLNLGQVVGSGTLIERDDDEFFLVIEACSGLRGILILSLVAVAIRDLLDRTSLRMWVLVALGPVVGAIANVIRIATIAITTADEALGTPGAQDHETQGVAVIMGGTIALYALGRLLERKDPGAPAPRDMIRWSAGPPATAALALLAALSFTPAAAREPSPPLTPAPFPLELAGWRGEALKPDRLFMGSLPLSNIIERRYRHAASPAHEPPILLFIGYQDSRRPRESLQGASKLDVPGREWSPAGSEPAQLWGLGRAARRVTAHRPFERAVSYVWHLDESSFLDATLRSALALPAPADGPPLDVVVRISTSLRRTGEFQMDRARRRLDRFVRDFRAPLLALEEVGP